MHKPLEMSFSQPPPWPLASWWKKFRPWVRRCPSAWASSCCTPPFSRLPLWSSFTRTFPQIFVLFLSRICFPLIILLLNICLTWQCLGRYSYLALFLATFHKKNYLTSLKTINIFYLVASLTLRHFVLVL